MTGPASDTALDVLHVVPTFDVGGVEQLLLDRVPRLRARGYAVGVCALGAGGQLIDEFRARGVPVFLCGMRRRADAPAGVWQLARVLARTRPALVHSHLFWSDLAVWLARAVHRCVWVSTKHDDATWMSAPTRWCERWLVRDAQEILADSRGLAAARRARGVLPRDATVVHLGAPEPAEATAEARAAVRAALHLPAEATVCTIVGRLHAVKAHDVLLAAWAALEGAHRDAHLLVCGSGNEEPALRAQAAQLAEPARVHFLGLRRDVPAILQATDLFVLPSHSEGFPVSIVEAMGAGLPVVATRVGGVEEAVIDDITGRLVPPGDPVALARALSELLGDPALRTRWGAAARERFRTEFTAEREVDKLEAIYARHGVRPGTRA